MTTWATRQRGGTRLRQLLDQPLNRRQCVLGWILASLLFIVVVHSVGGVAMADGVESIVPFTALAHGDLACSYPPVVGPSAFTAPLFPLLASPLILVAHHGSSIPFPSGSALGTNCHQAWTSISVWLALTNAPDADRWLGYLVWFPFLAGVIALVRTTDRAKTLFEPVLACTLAVTPALFTTVTEYFHPEDFLCVGLVLAGLAAVRRDAWGWVGAWFALAVLAQPFALLALLVVAFASTRRQLARAVPTAALVFAVVLAPLAIATAGRVLQSVRGTGDTQYSTTYWSTVFHITSPSTLELFARGLPLVLTALVAVSFRRRYGPAAFAGPSLCYLVAVAFALRILFEVNLWEYYYMAAVVFLVVADVLQGRLRPFVLLWVTVLWLWYHPIFAAPIVQSTQWPEWGPQLFFSLSALALAGVPAWRLARETPSATRPTQRAAPAVESVAGATSS
jgi:hypothetical protein